MSSIYKTGGNVIYTKIDECEEKEWEAREIYLIQKYKDLGYKLMNLDKGGKEVITAEKREKSSIERSAKAHEKSIILFDKAGNLVEQCPSVKYAADKYNLSRTSIGNVLHGRSKTCEVIILLMLMIIMTLLISLSILILKNTSVKFKTIYQFDLNGNFITFYKSKNELCHKFNYGENCLSNAIKNKTEYKESYWAFTRDINVKEYTPAKKI